MKQLWSRLKPYLRWLILGITLFFLMSTLREHWQEVLTLRIEQAGWVYLAIALGLTLSAHVWAGWVWGWILGFLNQPLGGSWSIWVYLRTNIAKYIPGNVWHLYGRVWAAKAVGVPLEVATLSIVLEPLMMAASALMIALIATQQSNWVLQLLCLIGVLLGLHPRVLNPALRVASRLKKPTSSEPVPPLQVAHYPLLPLLGELVFLGLRGAGFVFTLLAVNATVTLPELPLVMGAFSFAWLLGLVVPGAPGGTGVFEATAIALLRQHIPAAQLLAAVALYRLVSVLAEMMGAGIAWLYEHK